MRLLFYGLVQGVGFRPTVYRVAKSLGLKGFIRNTGSNVEVVINGEHESFLKRLNEELPPLAYITNTVLDDVPLDNDYEDFNILFSENGQRSSQIPTDTAICDDCISELFNKKDRRFHYPFINCTNCGARFSAIACVPYDRINTSMKDFSLCDKCEAEYDLPTDRRFYAQTISCPDDGPQFTLYGDNKREIETDNVIADFANTIDQGQIGVTKSWGGMHLICNLDVLDRFRKWYRRPFKPFAVMAKNIEVAKTLVEISQFEEKQLTSFQRPIMILRKKQNRLDDPLLELVSPGLDNMGLYLPYSAIQHLLFHYLKSNVIIMTSANPPGEPIIINNEDVYKLGADIYLLHNRNIIYRIDDSVIVPFKDRTFFIRKSRGFVPQELNPFHNKNVISVGPEENLTSGVSTKGKLYASQYIGDVRDYNVYEYLKSATYHLMELFGINEIDAIGCDLHPLYTSKRFARELGEKYNAKVIEIQHHWAHAVSLMVDNNITDPIVCLTLDGVGYGSDDKLWGGEIMVSSFTDFKRIARLDYLPLIGGDKAVSDPRRILFGISEKLGLESNYFENDTAAILKKAIKSSPESCSFGRFLDAISCHLGICCKKTYDGEPAIKLEKYLNMGERNFDFDCEIEGGGVKVIKTLPLFKTLFEYTSDNDLTEKNKADLAYSMITEVLEKMVLIAVNNANDSDIPYIGLTGGIAYDLPIVRCVKSEIEKHNLEPLLHNNVPCGDGGISVGQNAISGNLFEKERENK
jgi:hydrogenase maturation protein HypF